MQSNNKLRLAIRATAAATLLGFASQPVLAQSTAELQAQIDDMQRQLDQMKPAEGVKGWMIPGTDTTMSIGGYIKLDMIWDFDQDLGPSAFVAGLDTSNEESDVHFRAHARQTRINLATNTPTSGGNVKTYIEVDFFGSSGNEIFTNANNPRMRHAYGEWNGWLAGQTWTNFMHFTAYPSTVDFDGPVGVSFVRQAQLRYTMPLGEGSSLAFSAENAETTGFEGSRDNFPDLIAKYKWAGSGGGIELAALGRSLTSDSATGDDNAFGYGLLAAGRLNLTDSTTLMAGVIFGDGVGRYIYSSFSNGVSEVQEGTVDANDPSDPTDDTVLSRTGIGEAYIGANGDLETIEAYGANVAISQKWTSKFSSGLSYGRVEGDQPTDLFPNSFETLQSVHFSNFYQVVDPVTLGLEVSWQDKELANGESADNTRLQLAAQFSF